MAVVDGNADQSSIRSAHAALPSSITRSRSCMRCPRSKRMPSTSNSSIERAPCSRAMRDATCGTSNTIVGRLPVTRRAANASP